MPADLSALKRQLEREKEHRTQWDTVWQEVAELVMPSRATFTSEWGNGQIRRSRMLDSTAEQANEVWAEGMQGHMISQQTRWFHLGVTDPDLAMQHSVRLWLDEATGILYRMLNDPRSNFYPAMHQLFLDLGAFGSSVLFMPERNDDRTGRGLGFRTRFIGDAYVIENHWGRIDGVMFEENWCLSDLMMEFGKDVLPDDLKRMLDDPKVDLNTRKHKVVHSVVVRSDRAVESSTAANMPWASVWWMPKHMHPLRESGYREFPFAVPRLTPRTGEHYGVGIGIRMLYDIRMLQRMWETVIKAAQKAVDPPLQVPDDSFIGPVRTVPGGLNYFRSGTEDRITPLISGSRVDIGQDMLKEQREKIRKAWFNDVFDITSDSTGVNVKASFVNSRRRDKIMRLAPMFSLLEPDLLDPIINRAFAVAKRMRLLPPVPAEMEGRPLHVAYQSAISRAQRASEVDDIYELMQIAAALGQNDPSVLENIDSDATVQLAGRELLNVPEKLLRDPDSVAQRREQQQQQQQVAAAAQMAPGVASAIKDVSQAEAARVG